MSVFDLHAAVLDDYRHFGFTGSPISRSQEAQTFL